MKVTVYTKPNCPQCTFTKKTLDRDGIQYEVINAMADGNEAIINELRADGFKQFPVIKTETMSWSRFRPDMIAKLK